MVLGDTHAQGKVHNAALICAFETERRATPSSCQQFKARFGVSLWKDALKDTS